MKKKRPCKRHKISFGSKTDPTLIGMQKSGKKFRACRSCGWYIVKPVYKKPKKYSVKDLLKNIRIYARQNQ